jgi:cytoskeletal protein CcmA (bactofilin family)
MAEKHGNGVLSLIGSGTVVEGKIMTDGSVRVDGRLVGHIVSKANVTVGAGGVVEGTIRGANISLAGNCSGTIAATEKIVLETKSVMRGDITATRLVVDEGAIFDGKCSMSGAEPPRQAPAKEPVVPPREPDPGKHH